MKNKFKHSLKTGERVYSVSELAKEYRISNQLLYKTLVKLNILKRVNDKYKKYDLVDPSLGEVFYFSTDFKYKSNSDYNTTNVTVKFNERGLQCVVNKLATINLFSKSEFNWKWLEHNQPSGNLALSIREPKSTYNNTDDYIIYLSYRESRNGSEFSNNYFFISNEQAAIIKEMIVDYNYLNGTKIFNKISSKHKILFNNIISQRDLFILELKKNYISSLNNNKEIAKQFLGS